MNPRLEELLEKDRWDWHDEHHRAAFLNYWIHQKEENDSDR